MKYFLDPTVGVRAFESDGSQDFLITPEMRPLTTEEIEAHLNPVIPVIVPSKVTMRQARLALLQAGLLDDTETLIASLEGPEGQAARIEWGYSSEVFRNNPFVVALGSQLGLDDEQLDALFIAASQID